MPSDPATVTDTYHVRDRDSFDHAIEIVKPYGQIDAVLEWAKTELQGDWRWQMVEMSSLQRPGRYIFYFDKESDLLALTIKWL